MFCLGEMHLKKDTDQKWMIKDTTTNSEHNPKGQSFHQSRRAKDHLQKGPRAQGILLQLDHQL